MRALAEVGVSTGPTPDRGYQQRQHKAFEVVRKIRVQSAGPPARTPFRLKRRNLAA